MQEILLKPECFDERVAELRKEVIKKAEAMEDNYILQALLGNFRKNTWEVWEKLMKSRQQA